MTEAIETYVSSEPLSVSSACRTLDIARSTFYRYRDYDPFIDTDVELRDRVQKVALEWPSYGYRRITHELRRRGVGVGTCRLRVRRAWHFRSLTLAYQRKRPVRQLNV